MIEKGTLLRTKTQTKDDVMGEVLWEIVETGLTAPEKGRESQKDGVKAVMLAGTGARARAGLSVIDSEWKISQDIASGLTTVIPRQEREAIMAVFATKSKQSKLSGDLPRHGGTGVVEVG